MNRGGGLSELTRNLCGSCCGAHNRHAASCWLGSGLGPGCHIASRECQRHFAVCVGAACGWTRDRFDGEETGKQDDESQGQCSRKMNFLSH